jgi:hypothetical protein
MNPILATINNQPSLPAGTPGQMVLPKPQAPAMHPNGPQIPAKAPIAPPPGMRSAPPRPGPALPPKPIPAPGVMQ